MKRLKAVAPRLAALAAVALLAAGCSTLRSELPQSRWSDQETIAVTPVVVADGFDHPWGLAWLPDGQMLVTERAGRLWLLGADGSDRREVDGVPGVFAAGQGGLLDVSVDPTGGWVYLAVAVGNEEANRTEVSRYRLAGTGDGARPRLESGEVIFAVNEYKSGTQHFGSRLAWLPDGTLLISIGDGGNPPLRFGDGLQREQAQEETTLFGAIVRVNADGSIPDDNPFLGREGYRPEFFSVGHRNVQGLAVDGETGRVWASEHGSRGGDELNLLRAGGNYGWPLVSHSREYLRGTPVSRYRTLDGYEDPELVWLDTVAPSGLAVDGGTVWAGGLRSQSVHVISVDDDGTFAGEEVIPIGARVRDVQLGPDGSLWILTDEAATGRLLRITPAR